MFDPSLVSIANALVDANKSGQTDALLDSHYAQNAVSVEAAEMEGMPREANGLAAIKAKHEWWNGAMEMHSADVAGPWFFAPDRFAVQFSMDATNRQTGERSTGDEIAIYTVEGGKIVREEFYYSAGTP